MSSMLEQAVIDAAALKEAALKNAELQVLEKYAPQIKEAVDALLDQEEDPLSMGVAPTEDPLSANLPLAATDGENACKCPEEDEEIEIDFDELTKMSQPDASSPMEPPGQMDVAMMEDDMFSEQDAAGVMLPAQLGPELHTYHMSMGDPIYKVGSLAYAGKPVPRELIDSAISNLESVKARLTDPAEKEGVDELINQLQMSVSAPEGEGGLAEETEEDLTEEDLNNLLEMLEVDIENVPHGHIGHATEHEKLEAADITLARSQDTEIAEREKELKKAVDKLQEENQSLKKQINSFKFENNKFKGLVLEASRKLEELNVHNAQLVYKVRTLESVSLNERQKQKLVEAITKVNSVNEAKNVFDTLYETMTAKQDNRVLPKSLNEVAVSKNSQLILQPRNTINESINPHKERMQRLAGINAKTDKEK